MQKKWINLWMHLTTKINQEDINHLNRSVTHNEIEEVIESPK
jgi:hypothetical protein